MPHMMPMMWLFILIFSMIILFIIMSMIHFFSLPLMKNNNPFFMMNNKWIWKW